MEDPRSDRLAALRRRIDDLESTCARLARQVEELEEENAGLRELAGLARREEIASESEPEHEPRLFRVGPLPEVDAGSSDGDKLRLLRRLFRGRDDVYAIRWENARTGEQGYVPAVEGGWGQNRRTRDKTYLPLTDEVLGAHLRGEMAIGVFPLLEGDLCWFLACDFDGPSSPLDALAYHETAARHGIDSPIERSRSGEGAHAWIFFSGPVSAASARRLGACLLREAMATRAELDLASYDRFFPSQDLLPKAKRALGNLIALPLQGTARAAGNAVFVDPVTQDTYDDQWALLSEVRLVEPETVEQLATELDPPVAWQEMTGGHRPPGARPAPEVVEAELRSGVSVDKKSLPPWLIRDIKHLASIHNPEFYRKQRMRFSTHDEPRFIARYDEDLTHLHIPRGLREDLADLLEDHDSSLSVTDARPIHPPAGLGFQGELTPQQADVAERLARDDLGVLVAPPGIGKTVIGCALVAARDAPTLVLVESLEILEQWRATAGDLLGLDDEEIGQIGGGKQRLTGRFDIATRQSLVRRGDQLDEILAAYGHIVADECHHVPAVTLADVIKRAPARYVLGLTATPYRKDRLEGMIAMYCGPIRYEIDPSETPAAQLLRFELVVHETDFEVDPQADTPFHEVAAALAADETRTDAICRDVSAEFHRGRRCLVLTDRKDHLESLHRRLTAAGCEPEMLAGGVGKKARRHTFERIDALEPGQGFVLVATSRYVGEGFDCPPLDTLFLAFPISFRGRVVQYTGRILRPFPGKQTARVHDYVDTDVRMLARMFNRRLDTYDKIGFQRRDET